MYINYSIFVRLYNEAEQEENLDIYIAERGWQEWMGNEDNAEEVISLLQAIHRTARSDISSLRKLLEISQIEMVRTYDIPRNTLQQWENGKREPTEHVRKLLSYAVIMETLNKGDDNDIEE